jgi:hypothetical protein
MNPPLPSSEGTLRRFPMTADEKISTYKIIVAIKN